MYAVSARLWAVWNHSPESGLRLDARFEAGWRYFDDVSSTRVEERPKAFDARRGEAESIRLVRERAKSVATRALAERLEARV